MNIIYREGGNMNFYINYSPNRWLKTFRTFIKTLLVCSNFSTNINVIYRMSFFCLAYPVI